MDEKIRTYTIEKRGGLAVLMSWSADLSRGPLEVRQFSGVEAAKQAAELELGHSLAWRSARGEERKHDVVAAADVGT